ncbi:TPA: tRNA (adenosine(37)-N6)-dimethylallyltransferase MiaA [Candidatus Saccharibacteria bacterium]|nr:tRNA (adenosine(37)-N6)-dimethylallyltransferase MiaA [Candidatus Saccharibacteria bacterium]HRK41251.1 tRNA (adenosine(37)-N6)-dimethylallyltransferase MiaA [Candidatus Saccharibacteria bacterium]
MAPLIVITGPTASGKTGLALNLAEKYGGEIICADSRTIYRGMDIGTAKPTVDEQAKVPHHLLGIVEPGERYTARDFQRDANTAITEIRSRGKVPFLVGGTGLYIDAVTLDFEWPEQTKDEMYDEKDIDELQELIKMQHIDLPENPQNKRHLISTLKRAGQRGTSRDKPADGTVVVSIATDRRILSERIRARAEVMFRTGVVDETIRLAERYGWDSEAMKSNIYPIVRRVIDGELTEHQAIDLFVAKDMGLAKRQVTWLKRHEYVQWLSLDEAGPYIETVLA